MPRDSRLGASPKDDFHECRASGFRTGPRLPEVVQLGRAWSARTGACSIYESDSAGVLAALLSQAIGKHLRDHGARAGVGPELMPKHNSEPIGNGGPTGYDAPLSGFANCRRAAHPRQRPALLVTRHFRSATAE
jgi:hypothetical protein